VSIELSEKKSLFSDPEFPVLMKAQGKSAVSGALGKSTKRASASLGKSTEIRCFFRDNRGIALWRPVRPMLRPQPGT
jgi:hypothetical protein